MSEDKQLPATTKPQNPAVVEEQERLPVLAFKQGTLKATEKVEMQRATAEVAFSFEAAQRFGRDEQACAERIDVLCEDPYFCATALYKIPRGGDTVEGLGIHAALAIANIWGHMDIGYIEHGTYDREAQFEAHCWDKVTNNRYKAPFTVSLYKSETEKKKDLNFLDEIKARASKEQRNVIWRAIPFYIRRRVIKNIKRTLYAEVKDVRKTWDFLVKELGKLGVEESAMLRYVNRKGRLEVTEDDAIDIKLLYNRAKEDGLQVIYDAFPERNKVTAAKAEAKEATASGDKKVTTSKPKNPPKSAPAAEEKSSDTSGTSDATTTEETADPKSSTESSADPTPSKSGEEKSAPTSTAATEQESNEEASSTSETQSENADADATTNVTDTEEAEDAEDAPDLF